ncbi:MAG: phage protease [Rhodospirillales bacterium]|nr:phage protease [Rhodospirillales bacterium]
MSEVIRYSTALAKDVSNWVHLMPLGHIKANDGRKWVNNNPEAVVKASAAEIDLVIDYEHQTDYSAKNGQPAPAAGWIKAMEVRKDGIWGQVEWTDKARTQLENKEYRYLSPTFIHNRNGEVLRIGRAALTNSPAIHELHALAKEDSSVLLDVSNLSDLEKSMAKSFCLSEQDFLSTKIKLENNENVW